MKPERVLGDGLATRTGVVADDHPGRGARVDVDDVVPRAGGTDREQVRATFEQCAVR